MKSIKLKQDIITNQNQLLEGKELEIEGQKRENGILENMNKKQERN